MAKNRRIECLIRFGEQPVQENDRKKLADSLRREIADIFTQTDAKRFH
jgi:hypothetical protein